MLPRSMRGHSQALSRWAGELAVLPGQGAEPILELPVPPQPLLHCNPGPLERSLWMLSPGCRAGVARLSSPGVRGWVLMGWWGLFGGARCWSLLQQSLGSLPIPSTGRAVLGQRLLGSGAGCCRAVALRPVSPLYEEEEMQVIPLCGSWGAPAQGSVQEGWPCQGRGGQHVCMCSGQAGSGHSWFLREANRKLRKPQASHVRLQTPVVPLLSLLHAGGSALGAAHRLRSRAPCRLTTHLGSAGGWRRGCAIPHPLPRL